MLKQLLAVAGAGLGTIVLALVQLFLAPTIAFFALLGGNAGLAAAMGMAWVVALGQLSAPFVVPFIITSESDTAPSLRWAIYNTPDDPNGNQGMGPKTTEPQVVAVYDALGWRWKTYYWAGARNTVYGLANRFRPAYDFNTILFTVSGPPAGLQIVTATWTGGMVHEYRLFIPIFSKTLTIMAGYKLAEAYINSTWPTVVPNPDPDTDPKTDTGGVPFLSARFR